MRAVLRSFLRSVPRVYPGCIMLAQAVAFNMFLAFFPMLLIVAGVLTSSAGLRAGVQEMVARLRAVLPPGSQQLAVDLLARSGEHSWSWVLLGLGGTLLGGAQVMKLMMDGFRVVHGDSERQSFWSRQARALLLLLATIAPWLASVVLTVFGKQLRGWLIRQFGLRALFRALWEITYVGAALAIAMFVLAVVYRVGRPRSRGWNEVLPGAAASTLLWWVVNSAFGLYVRHVPYSLVYGGLAAAIGLLVWMQLSAMVVFLGAAFNAEMAARR